MFLKWLEAIDPDIYGVEDLEAKVRKPQPEDDNPIQSLGVNRIMKFLLKHKIGNVAATPKFDDELRWGERTGAVRIKITPNAALIIGQASNDLDGNIVWLCKRFYQLDVQKYTGKEDALAKEIYEKALEVARQPIDSTTNNYRGLEDLTKEIARNLRSQIPELFMYEEIKIVSPEEYIIYFSLRGSGYGKLARRRHRAGHSPFLDVDVSYNKDTGCIRIIITTTTVGEEGGSWDLDIPFFDEKFMPSQESKEISQIVLTVIRYF